MRKDALFSFVFIVIISIFPIFDLIFNKGVPATFDGTIHISLIAQFSRVLQQDFPVVWLNNFANYGLPVGIFAQQLPIYTGALINIITNNSYFSYITAIFLGIFFSNLFFYKFIRIYVQRIPAIVGVTLLTLSPLRIIDIYLRGDLPEIFASIFLPLILIGIYKFIREKNILGAFLIAISLSALTLSHPMMVLVYGFIYIPYFLFLLGLGNKVYFSESNLLKTIIFLFSLILGLGIAAYYVGPLLSEIKYFYTGLQMPKDVSQYLTAENIFTEKWFYFYNVDVITRGNFIFVGIIEVLSLFFGFVYLFLSKHKENKAVVLFFVMVGLLFLFFTTNLSSLFYQNIRLLRDLQFPWRMLSGFIFIPPIIYSLVLNLSKKENLSIVLIFIICIIRFPQLYGKNYTLTPDSSYYSSIKNLESVNFNTIWSSKSEGYYLRKRQGEIIEGDGSINPVMIKNSSREYLLNAKAQVNVVDNTFYFPGWNVYIDGIKAPIEFQDPAYRGVITFRVPSGQHKISVIFEDTKIRKIGKLISILSFLLFVSLFLFRKRLQKQFI